MAVRSEILKVTDRIRSRSEHSRGAYLDRIRKARDAGPHRTILSCGNLAHGFAACPAADKTKLSGDTVPNLGIITTYKDCIVDANEWSERETARADLSANQHGMGRDLLALFRQNATGAEAGASIIEQAV